MKNSILITQISKPDNMTREENLRLAYLMLKEARKLCAEARASKTLPRIRSAISSIKGAIRSAAHDCYRMERRRS